MEKRKFVCLAPIALALALGACAQQSEPTVSSGYQDVPLPADVVVVPPGPDVPRELAAFSGKWTGVWGGSAAYATPTVLVVEKVNSGGADVIYAWGSNGNPQYSFAPGFQRGRATFDGKTLDYQTDRISVQYVAVGDGTVKGTWHSKRFGGGGSNVTLTKVQ